MSILEDFETSIRVLAGLVIVLLLACFNNPKEDDCLLA